MDKGYFAIEEARAEDLKELVSFFGQHGRGLPAFPYRPDEQGRYSVLLLDQMFSNPHAQVYVALERATDIIVGHVSVHLVASMAGRRAELEMLLVHPVYRRRGLARALIVKALATARDEFGCDWAGGYNDPERIEARRLLFDLGFELEPFSDRRLQKWLR